VNRTKAISWIGPRIQYRAATGSAACICVLTLDMLSPNIPANRYDRGYKLRSPKGVLHDSDLSGFSGSGASASARDVRGTLWRPALVQGHGGPRRAGRVPALQHRKQPKLGTPNS